MGSLESWELASPWEGGQFRKMDVEQSACIYMYLSSPFFTSGEKDRTAEIEVRQNNHGKILYYKSVLIGETNT